MVRVVCMSDTHNSHHDMVVPEADILIHAGDATINGERGEIVDFLNWFAALPAKQRIFVPGNHDEEFFWNEKDARLLVPKGVDCLIGEGVNALGYLEVWGAPWVHGHGEPVRGKSGAFSFSSAKRDSLWEKIPAVVDILISHAPPLAVAQTMGDDLVDRAIWRTSPKLVVCGHIHWARGIYEMEGVGGESVIVVNAACSGPVFEVLPPIVVEI